MSKRKSVGLLLMIALIFFTYWVIEPIQVNPFKNILPNYIQSEIDFSCNFIPDHKRKFKIKADSIINYALDNQSFVGASVGVYKMGCGTWLGNVGYSQKQTQKRSDKNTLHRIASISKPMTAVAIMQLEKAGKLALDVPIQTYLSKFPKKDKGDITIRQLLTHTSGVKHYKSTFDAISFKYYPSMIAALTKFKDWELAFIPGTGYLYTTYGYTILGAIIEKVTGETYRDYMMTQIWKPAGMMHTDIEDSQQVYLNKAALYLKVKDIFIKSPETDLSVKYAGGGVQSTAEDLLAFGKTLLSNQLIDSTALELMMSPTLLPDGMSYYGLGWFIKENKKYGKNIEHGGAQAGTSTLLRIFLEEQVVVAVAANNMGSGKHLRFLVNELSTLALDANAVNKPVKIIRKQENKVLDKYVGTYNYKEETIYITRVENQLYLQKLPYPKVPFCPMSEKEFFCYYFDGQLEFKVNEQLELGTLEYTYEGVKEIWQFIDENTPN